MIYLQGFFLDKQRSHFDVWCNGSTTDFGSVSGGSNPPTLTLLFLMKIFLILSLWMIYQK